MFTCAFFLFVFCTAAIQAVGSAPEGLWRDFNGREVPGDPPRSFTPGRYRLFALDQQQMRAFLLTVPDHPEEAVQIELPAPDGSLRRFLIWETPLLEERSALQQPGIKTFTAVSADKAYVTAKLDYTLYGFHAMVYEPGQSYGIDPYSRDTEGYYMVYYTRDHKNIADLGRCGFSGNTDLLPPDGALPVNLGAGLSRQHGSVRHIYRLAVSCTGEYATAVTGLPAPTVPQVLSQIVSTVNRVNGIYERELSVSFTLIAANSTLIYTDPSTDPYHCNFNLDCLIDEAQNHISNAIGSHNFDVGHIFCTAGGGLAGLAVVCDPTRKASGTSTSGGPDDFRVIIHELGHQFGANHTFSAETGGCNGNGAEANAYEPGSGSTIMSYGGICAANDIVTVPDNYFHVASLREISGFLIGQGGGCGSTDQGVRPPALTGFSDSFIIPANTPFELVAPAAVPHRPDVPVLYSWEQFDLGNFAGTEATAANSPEGPLFRSYPPDSGLVRDYPIHLILNGSYSGVGERLPAVSRELHFKLSARTVFQGWGTFNYSEEPLKVHVAASPGFRVTQPAGAVSWEPGERQSVRWEVAGTDTDPVFCPAVNIYLSLDDGKTFPVLLASNVPNTGSYEVLVQNLATTEGRIKVQGLGNIFYDVAPGKISITGSSSIYEPDLNRRVAIYPNPAGDQLHIAYASGNAQPREVTLFNALGQQVWTGAMNRRLSISVGALPRGYYLLCLSDPGTGEQSLHKVVLE